MAINVYQKKFTTTIKKAALEMKIKDLNTNGFFHEYKDDSDFWVKRLASLKTPTEAVLLCGQDAHRFLLEDVRLIPVGLVEAKYRSYLKNKFVFSLRCRELSQEETTQMRLRYDN